MGNYSWAEALELVRRLKETDVEQYGKVRYLARCRMLALDKPSDAVLEDWMAYVIRTDPTALAKVEA